MTSTTDNEALLADIVAENAALKEAVAKLQQENARLSDQLTVMMNRLFAKSSERIDPNQTRLFLQEQDSNEANVPLPESSRKKKSSKGHGRAAFPPHLVREVIKLDLSDNERLCPDCGKEMAFIGTDSCERGHIIPARMMVRRYERAKYACSEGHAVHTAKMPPSFIDKGKYDASVYAHLAVAKYGDQQPLNRLEGIYKRNGFTLPKSTMTGMLHHVHEVVAEPIVQQMREELRNEAILHADETPTTVRLEDQKGSKQAYIWCYGVGKKWVYDFTMTRGRDGPRCFLGDWKGALVTDGYAGYDEVVRVNDIKRGGCWSHARRKVKEALETGATDAVPLMRAIGRLFWIERAVKRRAEHRKLNDASRDSLRGEVRTRRSKVVLERILELAYSLREQPSTLPKSALGKALTYLVNQWAPLTLLLDESAMEIHNNDAERALRHVVIGRKNWMFFGSERGGKMGASLFSLIATCKALDINPEAYLEDVITRVNTETAIDNLTPWAWAAENGTQLS